MGRQLHRQAELRRVCVVLVLRRAALRVRGLLLLLFLSFLGCLKQFFPYLWGFFGIFLP